MNNNNYYQEQGALPFELLQMVFSANLTRTDQYECLFVCKSWSRAAVAVYYREVNFSPGMLSYLRENQFLEYDAANDAPARTLPNGGYVGSLKVLRERGAVAQMTSSEMFVLLGNMPHLRVIDLEESGRTDSFFERIRRLQSSRVFNQAYPLTRLERIVLPTRVPPYCMTKYYRICYRNRMSITHLTIVNDDEFRTFIARLLGDNAGLEDFKNSFPSLIQTQML